MYQDQDFVAHGVLAPTPIPGWVVVAPRRHVEALTELDPELQHRWFAIATRVDGALRGELGATKVYLALFAEVVAHLHLHVIPRYADTPAELRGPRCFSAPPASAVPAAEVAAALARMRRALG